jgi:hypothetical protein
MAFDLTAADFALKELYPDGAVENLVYKERPLLALLPKKEDFYGKNYSLPVIYGNPQGRSANFTKGRNRGLLSATKGIEFLLTRVSDYGFAFIDNETMEAMENDEGAFLRAAKTEIDGCINSLSNSLASALFRAGYGDIGIIGTSGVSGATITLSNANDIVNFEVGMELVVAQSQAGHVLRTLGSSGNGLIVTAIDRDLGKLTFGANVTDATNGIPGTTDGDYLFCVGDREDSATPARLKVAGLQAWVPPTAPSSASFFGVDRTKDITRLGGLRKDVSTTPIEEALVDGAMSVFREGGNLDYYVLSPERFGYLEKALGTKRDYVDVEVSADIGFRALRVVGPHGDIKVLTDPFCPDAYGFGLTLSTWEMKSLKKLFRPMLQNANNQFKMIDRVDADGVEIRYGYRANLGCKAPGRNIILKF